MATSTPIIITGANGQLGFALQRTLKSRAVAFDRRQCDLLKLDEVEGRLRDRRPAAIVNCAAYTLVDKAESDAETCFAINATAVERLAGICRSLDCALVQISTDYVFGGAPLGRPWRETDAPSPASVYARSKLAGEIAAATCPKHFVVRTCGLYGGGPQRASFVEKMLQLAQTRNVLRVVNDQCCTPTFVDDLASAIDFLLTTDAYGIYHATNAEEATWNVFASEIFRLANLKVEVQPITSAEFGSPVERPAYSVLDNDKYLQLGGPTLRPWREALADYLLRRRPEMLQPS